MYNLNYQDNERMPSPSEGGERLAAAIANLQDQYSTGGIWVGNSVGGHMMLEAVALGGPIKPEHIVLYGPVLGSQSKVVELASMKGAPAIAFLDNVINGKGQFPVPVAGGQGDVPIGRDFFADPHSVWVQAFNEDRLDKMSEGGFSQPTRDQFRISQEKVADFRENMSGIGVTILAGEKDMFCHAGDIAAFKRDVAPHAEVVKMPGGHEWSDDRKDFFRAAIAPFGPKRPVIKAKPAPASDQPGMFSNG